MRVGRLATSPAKATFLATALAVLASHTQVKAYQTASVVSDDCHERITFAALDKVRESFEAVRAREMTRNERALVDDAPFPVPDGMKDLGAVSLALGNRDIDLRGIEPDDLDQLAPLHGDPENQAPHCLRGPAQDEPDGSQLALRECRAFIYSRVSAAIDGLKASGEPDMSHRTTLEVYLDIRGIVEANLPTYYVEMGRALHTLQDAFSHHYRTEDSMKTTAVLNYVELVEEQLDSDVDGPPHSSPMDQCYGIDEFRQERIETAARASAELLAATLKPNASRKEREQAAIAVIDDYLTFEPGCSADNDWCDAHERTYKEDSGCVCGFASERSASIPYGALALLALARLRRRRLGRLWKSSTGLVVIAALALSPDAEAQSEEVARPRPYSASPSDDVRAAAVASAEAESDRYPLGGYASFSGAVQNTALAAALGLRYRLSENWLVGVDAEYNPWIVRRNGELRSGVVNGYASVIHRIPMKFERVNIRTSFHAGVSRLMFDLYGAPEGSMGPYFGLNLLGLDIELSRSLYLVIDPADIAIPIPQTTGVPLVYPQYRVTIGMQFGA